MLTPEIEQKLDRVKRIYYDKSRSEVIRMLIEEGIEAEERARGLSRKQG